MHMCVHALATSSVFVVVVWWCIRRCIHATLPTHNAAPGDRIIDHLKKWLDPEANLTSLERAWLPGQEVQVAQAMLDTFYLLPQAGVRFLESQGAWLGVVGT